MLLELILRRLNLLSKKKNKYIPNLLIKIKERILHMVVVLHINSKQHYKLNTISIKSERDKRSRIRLTHMTIGKLLKLKNYWMMLKRDYMKAKIKNIQQLAFSQLQVHSLVIISQHLSMICSPLTIIEHSSTKLWIRCSLIHVLLI